MLFQMVQNHLFLNDSLSLYMPSSNLTHTWDYQNPLQNIDVECAHIWAAGKNLDSVCPFSLEEEWKKNQQKISAFAKSFETVGVNISELDLVDIIPEKFLKKYLRNKNQISEHVFGTFEKPTNYDFMLKLHQMIASISSRILKLDYELLKFKSFNAQVRNFLKKAQNWRPRIVYNPYGTTTGRLGVQSGSFPILNWPRELRGAILPNNDCFLELDFNAAELRVLLALNEREQPDIDIHDWNAKHIFKENLTRDEIKKKTFSWLYNPKSINKSLEMCYNKDYVLKKYFDGSHVNTIFDRKIEADDHHALNYIVQSTTSDLFLKQAIKIWNILKGKKTNVAFTIHDSLVLDFSLSDKKMVERLLEEFSNTELGKFKVNVSGGKNFGNMKKMDL